MAIKRTTKVDSGFSMSVMDDIENPESTFVVLLMAICYSIDEGS